jgi:TRAP transporter TAXI family solute receptor
MAIVQNDVMDYAYKGTELFNGTPVKDFSAMAAVYAEACQIVAVPSIKSIADLKGKNVSVGDVGSGTEFNARQILEAYGITFDDIKKQNLGFGPSADALRDGKIDAFFCVAGAPTTAIIDLAVGRDITILEVDDAHASALKQKYPFYSQLTIPGGSYKGVPNAVKTVTIKATFIVSNKLSADTVYKLTKTLIEDKEEIQAAHAKGAEISAAYAVDGISVPYHPGAEKYFKEIGALK